MATIEKKFLGTLGTQQLITSIRAEYKAADEADLAAAKKYADDLGVNYDAAGTAQTKVDALANGQVKTNTEHIGTMDNLETTAKSDLVSALNEVRNAVSAGGTAAAITMETTDAPSEGVAKAYTIKQGDNTIGTINIPSDMVVQSGSVVVDPEGQEAGTYIKLILANATNDEIFVNVGSLVDIYKAAAGATQVQLAIDSATREISASIVAGSIGATELAADAVTTVKIADGNVTKAKLSTEVQASLDKADAAKDYVDGRETQIRSDLTSAIGTAEQNAKDFATGLDTAMGGRVKAMEDKVSKWDAAEQNAKDYADGLDEAMGLRVKAMEDKVVNWDAAEQNAKDYADGLNEAMDERVQVVEGAKHTHENATVLSGITAAKVSAWDTAEQNAKDHADDLDEAMDTRMKAVEGAKHTHTNATVLDGITAEKVTAWDAAEQNAKNHADGLNTAMDTRVKAVEEVKHTHANATVLEGISAEKVRAWDAAEQNAKGYADELNTAMDTRMQAVEGAKHTHANEDVLKGITSDKVTAWDGAEQAAKTYADGLNTAMDTRVKALEDVSYVEITADEVIAMFAAQ